MKITAKENILKIEATTGVERAYFKALALSLEKEDPIYIHRLLMQLDAHVEEQAYSVLNYLYETEDEE